jgi:glycosyltransferase involved in cell wall biosynthesis
MKIICLSKRRPQQKDLITRPYGRVYFLPQILAQRGHNVSVVLLSYKPDRPVVVDKEGVQWNAESVFNLKSLGYFGTVTSLIRKTRPDWLIGFSDIYYGLLAAYLGQKYRIRCAIDAYDNYESYLQWCKPLHWLWRKAINHAEVVTAAGPQLAQYLNRFRPHKKVHIVPMAADPTCFRPMDKKECRQKLNLPTDKKLIGYCGSIYRNRGIQTVFSAYEKVHCQNPDSLLVLSGRIQKTMQLPSNAKHLGYLADHLIPILLNCMDVLLVPNQLTAFGNFSYPVKLYEAMICQIPLVATETAPAEWILDGNKQFLARPGDADDMAKKIMKAMQLERFSYGVQNSWESSCDIFEKALLEKLE